MAQKFLIKSRVPEVLVKILNIPQDEDAVGNVLRLLEIIVMNGLFLALFDLLFTFLD